MQKRNEAWNGELSVLECTLMCIFLSRKLVLVARGSQERRRVSRNLLEMKIALLSWRECRINGEGGLHYVPPNVSQFHPVRSTMGGLSIRVICLVWRQSAEGDCLVKTLVKIRLEV